MPDGPFSSLRLRLNEAAQAGAESCLNRDINAGDFADARDENVQACMALGGFWEAADCFANMPHWAAHAGTGGVVSESIRECSWGFGLLMRLVVVDVRRYARARGSDLLHAS